MTRNLETAVEIDTDINQVWHVLSGLEHYKNWNSATWFNKAPVVGKSQTMRVKLLGRWLAVPVKIQSYNLEAGLRWQGGITLVFTGSHYFKLTSLEANKTLLTQGEDFQGIFVPLLLPFLKKSLEALYLGMNRDIKNHCEKA